MMERGQRTETLREPVEWGHNVPSHASPTLHFHAGDVQPRLHSHPFPENGAKVRRGATAGVM